jgi:hypothetical protein
MSEADGIAQRRNATNIYAPQALETSLAENWAISA